MPDFLFRPRLIPGIAAAAGIVLFVSLGQWQAGKAERRTLEIAEHSARGQQAAYSLGGALVDPEQVRDLPVVVRGQFEAKYQFYVDNRVQDGKPGVHVVTPFRIAGTDTRVLVNRGWAPWPDRTSPLPEVAVPAGETELQGVAAVPSTKKFFLMPAHEDANPSLWTRLDLLRFEKAHPGALQPVVVLQSPGAGTDTLVRKWPPPEDRVAMHQSYALQWFGMAIALFVFYSAASLRKKEPA